MAETCPKATTTSATHCWHGRGQYTDSTGTKRSDQCCHCGEYRTVVVTPPPQMPPLTWTPPKHGPHAPAGEVRWG